MPEHANTPTTGQPVGGLDVIESEQISLDKGWNTVLHNDPVNTIPYVAFALIELLQIPEGEAQTYALTAHHEGRAIVFHGQRDEAESKVLILASGGLHGTAEKAS